MTRMIDKGMLNRLHRKKEGFPDICKDIGRQKKEKDKRQLADLFYLDKPSHLIIADSTLIQR